MRTKNTSVVLSADDAIFCSNYVRIPLGFWAVETLDSEPFLEGVAWQYFVRALGWARKYGLRVLLDLHGLPGSQNGWNHSGKAGVVNVSRSMGRRGT